MNRTTGYRRLGTVSGRQARRHTCHFRGRVRPGWLIGLGTLAMLLALPDHGTAQEAAFEPDTIDVIALDTVRVGARMDDLVGIAQSASEGRIGAIDLERRPIARDGELLETVPGVIVTQHSGEGKANQFFVRGFNLDHGTDFQTRVEGMPVNLPTHGHGQGYTDLNFLIPEFVDLLEYHLGVYYPEIGDFGSAGGAEIHVARSFASPFADLTVGEGNYRRGVVGGSVEFGSGTLLAGLETRVYDGPWVNPQNLRKLNGILRYSGGGNPSRWSVMAMGYDGRWDATDQIPLRAVESGLIDRFGAIDATDGGNAGRYSLSASWQTIADYATSSLGLFAIRSRLDLYSNFSYFLTDEDQGDQFGQHDDRWILGGAARHLQEFDALGARQALTAGLDHRSDLIGDVSLTRSSDAIDRSTIRADRVIETATGVFAGLETRWAPWIRTTVGLRGDLYTFHVDSDIDANSGQRTATIASPKASVVLSPHPAGEIYLSAGYGFHSNDARGVTLTVDPATGQPAELVDPLVRSRGAEVGLRTHADRSVHATLTAWVLALDSELLFVGDAGSTEAVDGSVRRGVTATVSWQPVSALTIDADAALARAELDGVAEGEDFIPGALERVVTGGIVWQTTPLASVATRVRHFGAYPLIEDNSIRAPAATLWNAEAGISPSNTTRIALTVLNLFDTEASDIRYFYESRLPGESAAGIGDVHFHPVEPRQLRLSVRISH